ncbi:hypothetical protein Cgig2_025681 [Carnegiea gigantea]|uniref:Uncharacterized protein n=1 Tax=Carnegiea gigantea TaxID=171969 RepID=A0A9Q1JTZ0_9CARY|nr:hypothetical protein Cgig2_025681 [Carnegiea gigantea]
MLEHFSSIVPPCCHDSSNTKVLQQLQLLSVVGTVATIYRYYYSLLLVHLLQHVVQALAALAVVQASIIVATIVYPIMCAATFCWSIYCYSYSSYHNNSFCGMCLSSSHSCIMLLADYGELWDELWAPCNFDYGESRVLGTIGIVAQRDCKLRGFKLVEDRIFNDF